MRTRILSLASAAICLFSLATAAQDGASRKLLQMDLAGLLGGGGGSGGCMGKGSILVNGPCAPFVQAFKANADSIVHADDTTFAHAVAAAPKPQAQCCADATAFVTAGCSCDANILDFAPYMGLNSNALITIARAATAVCSISNNPCVPAPAVVNPTPVAQAVPSPIIQSPVPQAVPVEQPAAVVVNPPVAAATMAAAPVAPASVQVGVSGPVLAPSQEPLAPSPSGPAPLRASAVQAAAPMVAPLVGPPVQAPTATVPVPAQMQVTPVQPIPLAEPQPLLRPTAVTEASPVSQAGRPYYEFHIPTSTTPDRVVRWETRATAGTATMG